MQKGRKTGVGQVASRDDDPVCWDELGSVVLPTLLEHLTLQDGN